jgi:peptidyl-prolyl cis-trans isomerase B (cyclophilin B)
MAGFWQRLRGAASGAPAAGPAGASAGAAASEAPETDASRAAEEVAVIGTSAGELAVEFWPDIAPGTVANFQKLARAGFFDGTCFHRVVAGFMIQGGDPLTREPKHERLWGTGDPGYSIPAEFNDRPHVRGVLSMARSEDPDSAGSQFFICLGEAPFLDGQYTAFGRLIGGDAVLGAIGAVAVTEGPDGERSRPCERVEVVSVRMLPRSAVS